MDEQWIMMIAKLTMTSTSCCNILKKIDQQNSMDAPDSPKEDALTGHGTQEGLDSKMPSSHSRHLLYTTHFPLPQVFVTAYL